VLYCGCGVMYVCFRYNESVIAVCMCAFVVVMILFSVVFLACFLTLLIAGAMSFEERHLANGSLGFSTWSPSLDRHLWAAECGYLDGPGLVRLGPGFVSMLAWLATLTLEFLCQLFGFAAARNPRRAQHKTSTC